MCGLTRSPRSGGSGGGLHDRECLLTGQAPAAIAEEQRAAALRRHVAGSQQCRSRLRQPAPEPVERHVADRNEPLAVALADDPHEATVQRELLAVEAERLADPQARGVEELEERSGAEVRRGLEEPFDLRDGEGLRQEPRLARQVDVLGDVDSDEPLAEREPVEAADARRPPPQARGGEARVARPAAFRPRGQVAERGVLAAGPLAGGAARRGKVREVGAVGPDRRRGEAALDAEVRQEVGDRSIEGRGGHVGRQPCAADADRQASARSSSSRAEASDVVPPAAPPSIWASSTIRPSWSSSTTSVTVRPSRSRFEIWK